MRDEDHVAERINEPSESVASAIATAISGNESLAVSFPVRLYTIARNSGVLDIRAASGARPVIRMIEWRAGAPEPPRIGGASGSTLVLDGVLIAASGQITQYDGEVVESVRDVWVL